MGKEKHPLIKDAEQYEAWAKGARKKDDAKWAEYLETRAKECRWLVKAGRGEE